MEEFVQNGEMKVTLKEQNADHSSLHQSAVPKEIWKYKTLRSMGFVAKKKHRRAIRAEPMTFFFTIW